MTVKANAPKPPIFGEDNWITVKQFQEKLGGITASTAYRYMQEDSGLEVVHLSQQFFIREATIGPMLRARARKRLEKALKKRTPQVQSTQGVKE